MEELMPCPFCGGEAEVVELDGMYLHGFVARCANEECIIVAETDLYPTEAEAIDAWNTRYHSEFEETVIKAWEEIKGYQERTCRIVKTWSDSDYVDDWNYRCSECRGFIPVNERDPETGDVISAANYCPNCGARVTKSDHDL